MKNCARRSYLLALISLAILQLSSCALTPDTFHSVTLSPKGTIYLGQLGSVTVTAGVLNDTVSNGGVLFSVSPAGIGTLTQTSSTTANYVAPAVVTTETIITITATSVDFPKQSTSLTVKIEPPPVITTTTLPSATLNQSYSQPVTATGGVPPLKWTIASGSLPAGLSLAASTGDTVNITGTPTMGGNSNFTIAVTDATGASNTSGPLNIVVSTLAFTTTSPLTPGTVGTPYSQQFAASGGMSPYTFAVASGSTLPAGLTLDPTTGILSGTPTTAAAGNDSFGVTVTDSEATPASITETFTLVISGPQDLTLLNGPYAFSFSGNNSGGFVAAAGTFAANGSGAITTGEADFTNLQNHTTYTAITGTYTVGTDGRGVITFASSAAGAFSPTINYAFAIDTGGSGHGRLIEFDAVPGRYARFGAPGGAERLHFAWFPAAVRILMPAHSHSAVPATPARPPQVAPDLSLSRAPSPLARQLPPPRREAWAAAKWTQTRPTTSSSARVVTTFQASTNPERIPPTAR
jgi:hypothetical protein